MTEEIATLINTLETARHPDITRNLVIEIIRVLAEKINILEGRVEMLKDKNKELENKITGQL